MVTVVFAGLIALALPQRSATPAEVRALFVNDPMHVAFVAIDTTMFDASKTTVPWIQDGTRAFWPLNGITRITLANAKQRLTIGRLELIDVQGACGNPPLTAAGWDTTPRVEILNGTLSSGPPIPSKDGSDQLWAYEAQGVKGSKQPHRASWKAELRTDATEIVLEGSSSGTIVLKERAMVYFVNDSPDAGTPGKPIAHYRAVYQTLLGITDAAKQFLPVETRPPAPKAHQNERTFGTPFRCPPLVAYNVAR